MADLGYGGHSIWQPLAMAERNVTKCGLVPFGLVNSDSYKHVLHTAKLVRQHHANCEVYLVIAAVLCIHQVESASVIT